MNPITSVLVPFVLSLSLTQVVMAQVPTGTPEPITTTDRELLLQRVASGTKTAISSTSDSIASLIDTGLSYLGIRYRRGGNGPETGGFDCSGLVKKVFGTSLGLSLPRTAGEMAKVGEKVGKQGLIPGDLVFFNTMNRAFSHVGIYLGNSRFLHSPAAGGAVRIESMDISYWRKRFNGGRRVVPKTDEDYSAAFW